jgi:hypothetical protein
MGAQYITNHLTSLRLEKLANPKFKPRSLGHTSVPPTELCCLPIDNSFNDTIFDSCSTSTISDESRTPLSFNLSIVRYLWLNYYHFNRTQLKNPVLAQEQFQALS